MIKDTAKAPLSNVIWGALSYAGLMLLGLILVFAFLALADLLPTDVGFWWIDAKFEIKTLQDDLSNGRRIFEHCIGALTRVNSKRANCTYCEQKRSGRILRCHRKKQVSRRETIDKPHTPATNVGYPPEPGVVR